MKKSLIVFLFLTFSASAQNHTFVEVHNELINLYELQAAVLRMDAGIVNWIAMKTNSYSKKNLITTLDRLPQLLNQLSSTSDSATSRLIKELRNSVEQQLSSSREVASSLDSFTDYEDGSNLFFANDIIESKYQPFSVITHKILTQLIVDKKMEFTRIYR